MPKYKIIVHTLTGSGIKNEKKLKVGDIIDEKSVDGVSAERFIKMGWIELVKDAESSEDWKKNHDSIDAKAEDLGVEFPENCTVKADKIKFIEDFLE